MKTLKEFNEDRRRLYEMMRGAKNLPNGIACPECGSELVDDAPDITLTSNPPQKHVHCLKCGYLGLRIA